MRKETLLLVLSTLFALGVAEITLSQFFPQRTVNQYLQDRPAMFRPSDTLFMDLKPNFTGYLREEEFNTDISINSTGHRQSELGSKNDENTRILVIGDSFTFGYGVEENDGYVRVAERELAVLVPGQTVELVNAGVPAWWTDSYYLYLKTRGLLFEPDVVIVGLFMGNDIDARDARHAIWPEVDEDGLPLATTSKRVRIDDGHRVRAKRRARWVIPVLRNSHLFQLIYTSAKNAARLVKPKVQAATLYQQSYSEETEQIIAKVKKLIVAMAAMSKASDARFVVVMIPERSQVYPQSTTENKDLDYAKPQRLFANFFIEQKINYVDLLPAIKSAADQSSEPLYYTRDSHFTRAGYLTAGRELARRLVDEGIVGASAE
jgi:hypothetical protein